MAEKKDAVKAAETKEAAPKAAKTTEKKPEEKKAAATKTETEKKAPAKKTPAKKADPKTNVVIEFAGRQTVVKDILAAATKAFKAAHKGVNIKTIDVYVKPEENVAYYVVNGEGSDDYKVNL